LGTAETLAEQFNLPTADVLLRKKFTKTQKDLKKEARIKNIASAFVLSPPKVEPVPYLIREGVPEGRGDINPDFSIKDHSFILIDDVTTTGATLLEAVKVLKRNGAEKVFCLTVAKD
jgi:competence protein ComFC